jgi:signal transduction histidine kinase/CHASE3 domain sensor protein
VVAVDGGMTRDRVPRASGALQAVALLLLVLLLLGAGYALAGLRDSEQWVRHTEEVRLELALLQTALSDAQAGQRGYLVTGDARFLEPYTHALAVWHPSLDGLRELTKDNPRQAQRLTDVTTLIERKLVEMKNGIEARDRGVTGAALAPLLAEGKRTMDALREALENMQRDENLLVDQRMRASARHEQLLFALLLAAGAGLALVAASAWAARSRQHRLATENAALEARAELEKTLALRRGFLSRAGVALASSLDYRTTLATVARLAVPELADWCSVELVEPGAAALAQVAVVHVDPKRVQFVRELAERYPPDPDALTGAPQVVRTGKSELYAEIPAGLIEAAAKDSEHLRIIRELRLESGMVVPLPGHDRVLGAMSFVYAESKRRYTESDLAFAEDFARRAALAIENAQAHRALNAALEFQERFVAILGHDLRNPLAAIDMASGLLAQRATKDGDTFAIRVLARVESSSRRMGRMIEQILDLARSRLGGGLRMSPSSMDLCAALEGIVSELRTAHPTRTIHLRCAPLPGSWDRDRLEQVFSNLVSNAIHHGDADKPVRIEAREQGGEILVEVHNEGPPIPEEARAELFSAFRRGDKDSRTARTAGLGLGLFISREIVVAHGGKLDVQTSSAEGTTFRVTLPLHGGELSATEG